MSVIKFTFKKIDEAISAQHQTISIGDAFQKIAVAATILNSFVSEN